MGMSAARIALKDISDYIQNEYEGKKIDYHREHTEVWVVAPWAIFNKQSRQLNKQLGINKVNYYGNKNGISKQLSQ